MLLHGPLNSRAVVQAHDALAAVHHQPVVAVVARLDAVFFSPRHESLATLAAGMPLFPAVETSPGPILGDDWAAVASPS